MSIDVSNVGDKLSMSTNIDRLVDLKEEFSPEVTFFALKSVSISLKRSFIQRPIEKLQKYR
jgi:hypothetical protein